MIAIGEPYNDALKENQGRVYIYTLQSGQFVQSQILNSPSGEQNENFGNAINFDGNQLAVNSLQGDINIATTFDASSTVFDNEFTRFKTIQKDSGAVYMYERINDTLVYAQEFIYEDDDSMFFGKNLLVRENPFILQCPDVQMVLRL